MLNIYFIYYRFKPNGEEIIGNPKYFINTSATVTILKIISLGVIDSGNYTLEAKNDYMIEKLDFTLDVIGNYLLVTDIEIIF